MVTSSPTAEPLIPRMRGRLHVYAFWGALVAASALVALAPSGTARAACAIYGTALCALFAVSALYHRWRWNPRWRPLLRRLDHSTTTSSSRPPRHRSRCSSSTGACRRSCSPVRGPEPSAASLSASPGSTRRARSWPPATCSSAGPRSPRCHSLPEQLSTAPLLLLAAGAALYIAGAAVYAVRRPDPWPAVFGFHEVFHGLVVVAAASHFARVRGLDRARRAAGLDRDACVWRSALPRSVVAGTHVAPRLPLSSIARNFMTVTDSLANGTRAAHDVGLAAWLGGAMFGKFAHNPSLRNIASHTERGSVSNAAWNSYNADQRRRPRRRRDRLDGRSLHRDAAHEPVRAPNRRSRRPRTA